MRIRCSVALILILTSLVFITLPVGVLAPVGDFYRYPLRVWVDSDDSYLWDASRVAAAFWENAVFEDFQNQKRGVLFTFVKSKDEADIIIAAKDFYFERGNWCVLLHQFAGGIACKPVFLGFPTVILIDKVFLGTLSDLVVVLLHELGHAAFKLPHTYDRESVMNNSGEFIAINFAAPMIRPITNAGDIGYARDRLRLHGVSVP